jgi:hypothetical protein
MYAIREEESLAQDRIEFEHLHKTDWLPVAYLPSATVKRVRLNVGGQVLLVCTAFNHK